MTGQILDWYIESIYRDIAALREEKEAATPNLASRVDPCGISKTRYEFRGESNGSYNIEEKEATMPKLNPPILLPNGIVIHEITAHAAQLAILSEWLDTQIVLSGAHPNVRGWMRITKVAEEVGEVISAWFGVMGGNPRKGIYSTQDDVVHELLDVAVTALLAVEHLTQNRGVSEHLMRKHIEYLRKRVMP